MITMSKTVLIDAVITSVLELPRGFTAELILLSAAARAGIIRHDLFGDPALRCICHGFILVGT
jgi:hypothetical protein